MNDIGAGERFKLPEHKAVIGALKAADADLFRRCNCYFGGGTAIVLDIGEYRLSKDIDFMCADQAGYRILVNAVATGGVRALFGAEVTSLREFRRDGYGLRTIIEYAGIPLKLEIIREARITLDGAPHPTVPVTALSATDRVAEKLLANADRGGDRSSAYRDAIDLGMIALKHGSLPDQAVTKATEAFGEDIERSMLRTYKMLSQPDERRHAASTLGMEPGQVAAATGAFGREVRRIYPKNRCTSKQAPPTSRNGPASKGNERE